MPDEGKRDPREADRVRVATVNTWKGDGRYSARLAALTAGLAEWGADLIALQEAIATADGTHSTARHLATALRLHVASHPTRSKPRTIEGQTYNSTSELAVLSRWPVLEVDAIGLPHDPADGDRAALLVAIETPVGTVRLANTHLTHLRERSDLRSDQLDAVVGHAFLGRTAAVRLLAGDMNATRESQEIARLRSGLGGWHVLDTYEAGGGSRPGATMSSRNPHVDARVGERAIDYIFSLAPTEVDHPPLTKARVVLDQPFDGVYPSDHFGVAVTVARREGGS